uniref:Thioredoxin reductase n=1 Tax=uncultured Alphaproteobacteria bacterium TaxID=91750 RepID=A0A6G8F3A8_9PROT|nr:thioredoxin reductase [uncultured Alphaproteobacteria bacterium]
MAQYQSKIIIIGSGPAGYTAGIYAARAGLSPLLVSGFQKGGQLTITTDVENYPGFPEPISGPELMERMQRQAENLGVKIVDDHITEVDFSHHPFTLVSELHSYQADCVIIATGASARWLGLENEEKFRGFGVSGCATCDGFFYRNRKVAVVGGGNTAAEEALYLANIASSVTLIHRRDELRADKTLQNRIFQHPKIAIEWDSVVTDVKGTDMPKSLTGVVLKNLKTDKVKELDADGLFIAIGHKPNTEIFKSALELDKDGYIITKAGSCQTSVIGVFAAGDVKDSLYRQAVTAAGSGCQAFLEADKFLNGSF